ncbi:MAG: hypothetical protein AAFV96_11160, partial [Pseudomonadota bacterium]
ALLPVLFLAFALGSPWARADGMGDAGAQQTEALAGKGTSLDHTPLTLEGARRLLGEADVAGLAQAFAAHAAAYSEGGMSGGDFAAPFGAFYVSDPQRIATLERWREAAPESADPYAALANIHLHIATVYRGQAYAHQVFPPQAAAAREHWAIARGYADQALARDPGHLVAASALANIGRWTNQPALSALADRLWAPHASPLRLLRQGINRRLPQWSGSMNEVQAFCRAEAPSVEGVSIDECLAVGVIASNKGDAALHREALAVLRADTDGVFRYDVFRALMRIGARREAAVYAEAEDLELGYQQLRRLPRDAPIVRRMTELWLSRNPTHPYHNMTLAEFAVAEGDETTARAALERAQVWGRPIATVQAGRGYLLDQLGYGAEALAAIEEAIENTDNHGDAWLWSIGMLLNRERPLGQLAVKAHDDARAGAADDGTMCRLRRVLAAYPAACAGPRAIGGMCADDVARRVNTMRSGLSAAACGG